MGGNSEGQLKGAQTKKKIYGEDFFAKTGAKGGAKSLGRKLSEETKRKISETIKRKKLANGNHDNAAVR